MKSAVETLTPTRVRLTVEVPFEELKPSLDAAYKRIAPRSRSPASARARCPTPLIDQRVGRGAVLDEAVNDDLPDLRRCRARARGHACSASPRSTSPSSPTAQT